MKRFVALFGLSLLILSCAGNGSLAQVPGAAFNMVAVGGGGSGDVTASGTFTAGDLLVGGGSKTAQSASNVGATTYSLVGQSGSQSSGYGINAWTIPSDAMNCTAAGSCDGWQLNYSFGGSTLQGARQALDVKATFTAASSGSSTNTNYAALVGQMTVNSADGGTNTGAGARGSFFGGNPVVRCNNGATNLAICSGLEVDTVTNTGSSMKARVGISSVAWGGAVTGASLDAAFVIATANAQTGANWLNGIRFERTFYGNQTPLATTGCMICTDGNADAIATGFDLGSYTVSGDFIRLNSSNKWSGAGLLQSTTLFAASWMSVGSSGQANATDLMSVRGNTNAVTSATLRNGNAGTAAQATLYITNDTNSTRAGITLNGSGFSGGFGSNALQIFNASTSLIVVGTNTETIRLPSVTTGTPTASLCLDASLNIVKKTTSGACI